MLHCQTGKTSQDLKSAKIAVPGCGVAVELMKISERGHLDPCSSEAGSILKLSRASHGARCENRHWHGPKSTQPTVRHF